MGSLDGELVTIYMSCLEFYYSVTVPRFVIMMPAAASELLSKGEFKGLVAAFKNSLSWLFIMAFGLLLVWRSCRDLGFFLILGTTFVKRLFVIEICGKMGSY